MPTPHRTPPIQSLDRGLVLLEAVAKARRPVSLGELVPVLGIDRSSVFRLANTLGQRGFLAQLPDTKEYTLGPAVWRLASLLPWSEVLARFARDQIAELATRTGETTHLAVREGQQAALIHHQLTERALGCSIGSGHHMPLHGTAIGRALLTDFDRESLAALLGDEPLPRFSPKTLCSLSELADDCRQTRQRGYVVDDEEYLEGIRCIAAPIRDPDGLVVAAVAVSSPVDRLPKRRYAEVGRMVVETAQTIGAKFRFSPQAGNHAK